jgi:uncharacterized surface protein with fasciclin (FAS1) repeats
MNSLPRSFPSRYPAPRSLWPRRLAMVPALLFSVLVAATSLLRAQTAPAATAAPKGTILAVLKDAGKFSTLLKAVEAAGLTATLEQPGPYTVFAPTDEAFAKLPTGTLDKLLKPESKAKLVAIVNYHIAPGKVGATALAKLDELKTLNGEEIDVDTSADGKTVEMDDSKVVPPELDASNGVVHVIDAVLQP